MNTPDTRQLQSQTLNALNDFFSIWNQDLLASTNSLVLIGNQITVLNKTNILLSITFLIEPEALIQDLENEQETLENIFSNINLDNLIPSTESEKEPISLSQEEIGNYDKETTEESSLQKELDLEKDQSISNSILTKLIDNLMIKQEEIFTRINPLIGITYKEKLKEIIS